MGGWAVFANLGHPMPAPLVAGLVQGTLTALITLGLKRMVEGIVARTSGWAAALLPPLAACAVSVDAAGDDPPAGRHARSAADARPARDGLDPLRPSLWRCG